MMSCLCLDDLRPASFRGVPFYVESDRGEYGRRNVVNEYPNRDVPYVEDMGEKARKYHVTGYLYGDDWVAKKDALVAACTAGGPAILQLPTEAPTMVACSSLTVSRTKDACGFYSIGMEFVVTEAFGLPFVAGVFEGLIGSSFSAAVGVLSTYYTRAFDDSGSLQYVEDRQAGRIASFAATAIVAIDSSPTIDSAASTNAVQSAISLYQTASQYANPPPEASNDLVSRVADIVAAIGDSVEIDAAIASLTELASWSLDEVTVQSVRDAASSANRVASKSELVDATNGSTFCGVVRSFALMKLAQLISVKDFRTRQEAIQARATIVELFNVQIEQFDEDEQVNAVKQARDYAVQAISQKMTTLVPVVTVAAPESRPSLYWAARLYQDVTRAEELAERNAVVSPAFMPGEFEALAS